MNMDDYKEIDDIVYCASGDGNIAAEYATHPSLPSVPLCEHCADALRKLQETCDNEVKK